MGRKKKVKTLPDIPEFLSEKEGKALVDAFNFIAARHDCKEQAVEIANHLKPVAERMSKTGCDGTLNNMMLCFISRLQGYNVGISYRYYLNEDE